MGNNAHRIWGCLTNSRAESDYDARLFYELGL